MPTKPTTIMAEREALDHGSEIIPNVPYTDDGMVDPRFDLAQKLRHTPGLAVRDICRKAGIGMATYYIWFPATSREAMRTFEAARAVEMQELRDAGWTDAAIGRHYKVSRARVGALLGKRGKRSGNGLVTVTWRATPEAVYRVTQQAIKAGAYQDDKESKPSIPHMLNLVAQGMLIVTAPIHPKKFKQIPKDYD